MKAITYPVLMVVLATGFCAGALAASKREYPQITANFPSSGKTTVSRDEFITLVIEGATITYESNAIPATGVVDYVNNLLKTKNISQIGVYSREGASYGDVVRAMDLLRETNARNIGLSMAPLAAGREL